MSIMEPHEIRVHEEYTDLDAKIYRLKAFVDNFAEKKVSQAHQRLLARQLEVMRDYRHVLDLRIEEFKRERK